MEVRCQKDGPTVWRLTLDGGAGDATLDGPSMERLADLFAEATSDGSCRAIVLEGAGGSFCGGMHLGYVASRPPGEVAGHVRRYVDCLGRMRRAAAVVIAAVDGAASGGGLGLMAAADLALATRRSTFALPELALGLKPLMVLPVLLERMPPHRVRYLALAGEVGADEASRMGLVDRVVADAASLERRVDELLRRIHRLRPSSVEGLKRLTGDLAGRPVLEGLDAAGALAAGMLAEPELLRALRGYLAGDSLPWFDRPSRRSR
jgi:enoyl-CoA hydratase/carnithine racemase